MGSSPNWLRAKELVYSKYRVFPWPRKEGRGVQPFPRSFLFPPPLRFGEGRQGGYGQQYPADACGAIYLPFRKAQRGREEKTSMKPLSTPAAPKKGYAPHDCKQYDLPSGALESLAHRNIQALWPSTNTNVINKVTSPPP